MQAVFMTCVIGGNLSSGAAMKYSYIIGWHENFLLSKLAAFVYYLASISTN